MSVREKLLKTIRETPGITASELARRTGASHDYVYLLVRKMGASGQIRVKKEGVEGTRLTVRACYPA
jgi:predicted transcriptional regulator